MTEWKISLKKNVLECNFKNNFLLWNDTCLATQQLKADEKRVLYHILRPR